MGDPGATQLDQAELVRALIGHGVRFVLVGGAGANAHGSERFTTDLDIVPEWTTENLDRLAEALAELGARLRVAGMPEGIEAPLDARMLVAMELSTWRIRAGDLDLISRLPHGKRAFVLYGELASDIIISKETVDRPADRRALPELRELRSKGQG